MSAEPTTQDVHIALEHCASLLTTNPALAEAQAQAILAARPGEISAKLMLTRALRAQLRLDEAERVATDAVSSARDYAPVHFELGVTRAGLGNVPAAIDALREATRIQPDFAPAWNVLADVLASQGDTQQSAAARWRHLQLTVKNPELVRAGGYLFEGKLAKAEAICRHIVREHPTDVSAIRMLADVGSRLGQHRDARALLERCLELAPDYRQARSDYAQVLHITREYELALGQLDLLRAAEPNNPHHELLRASVLVHIGQFVGAIEIYDRFLARHPGQARAQMSYGHALKTVGRQSEAIKAYSTAIQHEPTLGESYWSLANLKTFRFDEGQINTMRELIAGGVVDHQDHYHLRFALGKALEDRGQYAEAFENYRIGNAIRRERIRWDADAHHDNIQRHRALFDQALFARRAGCGSPARDPIFVVGLPRAGSTLLEQILASHSQIEGTMELPDIIAIARRLDGKNRASQASRYPEVVAELSGDQLTALGEEYLERTRIHRSSSPFFIDKMPNNFAHIGMLQLILPNARIIDARRHPLACCFSGYKQLFASGQNFTYDLTDIGRYYRDYVELMEHWDRVLPGRVLRVHYEQVVADTEAQVRRLLDYCGLPFEPACLAFHDTDRPVRTASSEQVRQPIYAAGVDQWRHFDSYLEPLIKALGPAATY